MDINNKFSTIEQELYTKYPHLQPTQQIPQQTQYQQQEQHQQQEQKQIEADKRIVCDMLIDYYNEKHERLSTIYMINTLYAILSRPLAAEDQMYYKKQLNAIENSTRPQQQQTEQAPPNFKSAEDMVNNSNKKHNKNNHNGNNKNRDSQKGDNMV